MSLLLKSFESFFSDESGDSLYIEDHQFFVDDLQRWFEVCSSAFEKPSFVHNRVDDCVYLISNSLMDLLGYNREEFADMGPQFLRQLMHHADSKELDAICNPALNELIPQHTQNASPYFTLKFNFRIRHKKGHYLTLDCFLYPIYSIDGVVHFTLTYIRPTTRLVHVNLQVYFMYDNMRFIYNRRLKSFLPEKKARLDDQELLILNYTAKGNKEYEIAEMMNLDVNRVKYYKKRVMKKLSVHSMPEALYFALKMNLI